MKTLGHYLKRTGQVVTGLAVVGIAVTYLKGIPLLFPDAPADTISISDLFPNFAANTANTISISDLFPNFTTDATNTFNSEEEITVLETYVSTVPWGPSASIKNYSDGTFKYFLDADSTGGYEFRGEGFYDEFGLPIVTESISLNPELLYPK